MHIPYSHAHFSFLKKNGCNWLLRSEETSEFDLLQVDRHWKIWVGAIGSAEIDMACNECESEDDCNLNGLCTVEKICACKKENGVEYLGNHCEVSLRDECRTITGGE